MAGAAACPEGLSRPIYALGWSRGCLAARSSNRDTRAGGQTSQVSKSPPPVDGRPVPCEEGPCLRLGDDVCRGLSAQPGSAGSGWPLYTVRVAGLCTAELWRFCTVACGESLQWASWQTRLEYLDYRTYTDSVLCHTLLLWMLYCIVRTYCVTAVPQSGANACHPGPHTSPAPLLTCRQRRLCPSSPDPRHRPSPSHFPTSRRIGLRLAGIWPIIPPGDRGCLDPAPIRSGPASCERRPASRGATLLCWVVVRSQTAGCLRYLISHADHPILSPPVTRRGYARYNTSPWPKTRCNSRTVGSLRRTAPPPPSLPRRLSRPPRATAC